MSSCVIAGHRGLPLNLSFLTQSALATVTSVTFVPVSSHALPLQFNED